MPQVAACTYSFLLLAAVLVPGAVRSAPVAPLAPDDAVGTRESQPACPRFRWSAPDGDYAVSITVHRMDERTGTVDATPVLSTTRPARERAWTPETGRCLGPGAYAWTVRDARGPVASVPAPFQVSGLPDDAELRAAMAVIERHLEGTSVPDSGASSSTPASAPVAAKALGDATAIVGLVPDATGSTRGVHGVVASADGAGVLAENTNPAGYDLQLAGTVPALVSEREWRLASGTAQSVDFTNPAGAMTLKVQGVNVVTTATDQDTTYAAGNQLSLAVNSNTFNVLEGPGSGLDADTLDGLNAAEIGGNGHDHIGQVWTGNVAAGLTVSNANASGSGLLGSNTSASGFNYGVRGTATSINGRGVLGEALASTGGAYGVFGVSASTSGHGVSGRSDALTGNGFGVFGRGRSPTGAGGMFVNDGGGLLIAADDAAAPNLAALEFSVDNDGNVVAESYAGNGAALTGLSESLFGNFGGDGSNGARIVAGTESVALRAQYTTLTLNAGSLLQTSSADGRAYIAVQGLCSIRGTISGRGRGAPGAQGFSFTFPGQPGRSALNRPERPQVPGCVSGAGGGGGTAVDIVGGNGGGAEGDGGADSLPAESSTWKRIGLSGGSLGTRTGDTRTDGFAGLLACPGAGGGSGGAANANSSGSTNAGGNGGAGGAVIYLECGSLELTSGGTLDARGANGSPGTCSGTECATQDGGGGGGGGGGGVVLVRTRSVIDASGQILVTGGSGGASAGFASVSGGAGATGYADVVIVR